MFYKKKCHKTKQILPPWNRANATSEYKPSILILKLTKLRLHKVSRVFRIDYIVWNMLAFLTNVLAVSCNKHCIYCFEILFIWTLVDCI